MAGEFVKSFLDSAKKMVDSLQLFQAMGDSTSALLETIREVPEYVRSWKESSARHGARMAFSVVKSAYKEVDIAMCSKGLAKFNNHGEENNTAKMWDSMAGYDQCIMKLCNLNQRLDSAPRPPSPQVSEVEDEDEEESSNSSSDQEEETPEDEPPKSPAA